MHDDDESKREQAEFDRNTKWLFDEIEAGNLVLQKMFRKQLRLAFDKQLEEMAVDIVAVARFMLRDVSEFDYAELKKLAGYARVLLFHVRFKQLDGEFPPPREDFPEV